ncbi:hypothetical protein EC973_004634 [Apophysomyces ossiformis]|uniref:Uncharacterized protein n=1 Tax=Apophysomyces ossiformis TaxID=679940 RepID=A0A8H7EKG8_9FUNG|nr:hypothetical protein EC973_004634 [Apophysomyces ossiformis]
MIKVSAFQSTKPPSSILIKKNPSIIKFSQSTPYVRICECGHRRPSIQRRSSKHTKSRGCIPCESSLLPTSDIQTYSSSANSEDLTAKEFASITGIKILPEDSDDEDRKIYCEQHTKNHAVSTQHGLSNRCYNCPFHQQVHEHNADEEEDISVYSDFSMQSQDASCSHRNSQYQIWDSRFWQKPENMHPPDENYYDSTDHVAVAKFHMTENILRKPSQRSTATMRTILSDDTAIDEPPILQELRRMNSKKSAILSNTEKQKVDNSRNCVIRKGRFEIHLETAEKSNQTENSITSDSSISGHSLSRYPPADAENKKKVVCIHRSA